ncbi:MAG: signal recognition particle-docking protein FtsY, partial [archaeon]
QEQDENSFSLPLEKEREETRTSSHILIEEPIATEERVPRALPEMHQKDERKIKANVGVFQRVSGMVTGTLTLKKETIETFLEEFEFSLLEADVEMETATALVKALNERLSNKTISSKDSPEKVILNEIRGAMHQILPPAEMDFDSLVEKQKPCIVLILGPNGAGKTTTIAKITHRLTRQGKRVVLASADTFRAGSIEQLAVHAERLGVRLVRHHYGADPAAVGFDAVKAGEADGADVVIIDTAGRQDTNKNLLEELKKITRVVKPHIKLYVGESYTGQTILTQARTFDEAIGIDGFVLTKLDTDSKGGGVLSILYNVKKPIAFFGTGQGYDDLAVFSLDAFLERIIPHA